MDTIALRYADNIAPAEGTIKAHERIIIEKGYVWYGKFGAAISSLVREELLTAQSPKILLIHSGTSNRYWAYIDAISSEAPSRDEYPVYYQDQEARCGSWFRVTKFEKAPADIMAKCIVKSSGAVLSNASRHSMSPYFVIQYKED